VQTSPSLQVVPFVSEAVRRTGAQARAEVRTSHWPTSTRQTVLTAEARRGAFESRAVAGLLDVASPAQHGTLPRSADSLGGQSSSSPSHTSAGSQPPPRSDRRGCSWCPSTDGVRTAADFSRITNAGVARHSVSSAAPGPQQQILLGLLDSFPRCRRSRPPARQTNPAFCTRQHHSSDRTRCTSRSGCRGRPRGPLESKLEFAFRPSGQGSCSPRRGSLREEGPCTSWRRPPCRDSHRPSGMNVVGASAWHDCRN